MPSNASRRRVGPVESRSREPGGGNESGSGRGSRDSTGSESGGSSSRTRGSSRSSQSWSAGSQRSSGSGSSGSGGIVTSTAKLTNPMLQVIPFILVTELCERLAFFGFTGSLPIFFTKVYGFSSNLSAELNLLFVSLVFISPVFGAWIADIYIGRYRAITSFGLLYFLSSALVTIGAIPTIALGLSKLVFFVGLLGITVASGGIKPNVATFGADQFDATKPDAAEQRERFFGYFYWSVNFGSLIAFGVITNIATGDIIPHALENWRFFASFIVPCVAMAAAVTLFMSGSTRCRCCGGQRLCGGYVKPPASKSEIHRICSAARKTCCVTQAGRVLIASLASIILGFVLTTLSYFVQPAADQAVLGAPTNPKATTTTPPATTTTPSFDTRGSGTPPNSSLHFFSSLVGFLCMAGGIAALVVVAASPTWIAEGWRQHQKSRRRTSSGASSSSSASASASASASSSQRKPSSARKGSSVGSDVAVAIAVQGDSCITAHPSHLNRTNADAGGGAARGTGSERDQARARAAAAARASTVTSVDVENLRMIVRLLPYCGYMALFWASNSNMSSNFLLQACQMNLLWFVDPSRGPSQLGVAFLTVFNTLIICVLVPVVDFVVYPLVAKCRGGRPMTVMERILAGFIFATLSTVVAGFVEVARKQSPMLPGLDPCCRVPLSDALFNRTACCKYSAGGGKDTACMDSCQYLSSCSSGQRPVLMHTYSVWWQCLQYTLTGIAEVFAAIAAFDLFYSQVPASVRSLNQALNLLAIAVGSTFAGAINSVFAFWLPDDLDQGRLEYIFVVHSVITIVATFGLVLTSRSFVPLDIASGGGAASFANDDADQSSASGGRADDEDGLETVGESDDDLDEIYEGTAADRDSVASAPLLGPRVTSHHTPPSGKPAAGGGGHSSDFSSDSDSESTESDHVNV